MHSVETLANAAQKKARTALDRIEFIEGKLVPTLAQQTNSALERLQLQMVEMGDFINALIDSVGAEAVKENVEAKRNERALQKVEVQKKELDALKERGTLIDADKVSDHSIVVGSVKDAEGKEVFPGWEAVAVAAQPEDIKPVLVGAEKGAEIKLPNGNTFSLQAIYDAAPTTTA